MKTKDPFEKILNELYNQKINYQNAHTHIQYDKVIVDGLDLAISIVKRHQPKKRKK